MKFNRFWLIIAIIIAVAATVALFNLFSSSHPKMSDKINLTTSDNVKIAADFYKVEQPKGWLILIHMMPATKESWREFAEAIQKQGYESLVIDLRGHGKSQGGPTGYQQFFNKEHQVSINDLKAAWDFLKSRGALPENTAVIGGSIGANLALQFLTEHPEVRKGVFLSAGNYRGIDSGVLVKKLNPGQSIIFAASKQDNGTAGNNAEQNKIYYDLASQVKNRHLILFEGAGHGTDLFNLKNELDLTEVIKKFLENGTIY